MGKMGTGTEPKLRSGKQKEIMRVIIKGNPDGTFCDIDQILDSLSYDVTKQAFHFSLKPLIRKGLAEKEEELRYRDGSHRRVIKPTMEGYAAARGI